MDPLVVGAVTGGLFLLAGLSLGRGAKGWLWSLAVAFVAIVAGFTLEFISTASPLSGFPAENLWLLLAWIEFAHLISISGLRPKGNLGLLAFCGGAFVSDLGAAALLAPFAGSTKNRGRVALTASAGAMITNVGTPATVLFADFQVPIVFAVALAVIVWPSGSAMRDVRQPMNESGTSERSIAPVKRRLIIPACLTAFALIYAGLPPFWVISALDVLLIILIGPRLATTPWRKELYILAIAVLAGVAVAAGSMHQLQIACNSLVDLAGNFGAAAVAVLAGLLSSLGGEEAASLVLSQSFQRGAYGPTDSIHLAAVMGLAVGGLGPLIAARAFRASIGLFILQFGLMVVLIINFGV